MYYVYSTYVNIPFEFPLGQNWGLENIPILEFIAKVNIQIEYLEISNMLCCVNETYTDQYQITKTL